MVGRIDPRDLVDTEQVKEILGLSSRNGVRVYRARYSDFPAPVIERGRCVLWLARDVREWADARRKSH
jgi:predicted DNA-binding transcriptional regulator AlpA